MEKGKEEAPYLGMYFDRDSVLRLEKWARVVGWATLAVSLLETLYNAALGIFNAAASGYPLDGYFYFSLLTRLLQGAGIWVGILLLAKALLILMDIEDNTRRAARQRAKAGEKAN